MKNKASAFLKHIISALTSMAKAKTLTLKSKTRAIKARLIIFSLVRNRKFLMTSISQKLQALTGHHHHHHHHHHEKEDEDDHESKPILVYNHNAIESLPDPTKTQFIIDKVADDDDDDEEEEEVMADDDDKYPDLTHSLFDSENMDFEDPGGSVIDMVKNSKEQKGQDFRLEDEIDRAADLFIRRFHRQMWMQKQLSFKRYQEMLERSA